MGESGGGGGRPGLSGARGGRVGVSAAPVGSGTDIGTRYPTLHRLEADGLLVSEQWVSTVAPGVSTGRPRPEEALDEDRRALGEPVREVLGTTGHPRAWPVRRRAGRPGGATV